MQIVFRYYDFIFKRKFLDMHGAGKSDFYRFFYYHVSQRF